MSKTDWTENMQTERDVTKAWASGGSDAGADYDFRILKVGGRSPKVLEEENQNLLGKIERLNRQRLVTAAKLENQSRNLKVVREAVGECNEGGNKLAAALIESMQRDCEILEHELRNFS